MRCSVLCLVLLAGCAGEIRTIQPAAPELPATCELRPTPAALARQEPANGRADEHALSHPASEELVYDLLDR